MTQDDFNNRILSLLADTVKELRRSTRSHDWDDMPALQAALALPKPQLPVKSEQAAAMTLGPRAREYHGIGEDGRTDDQREIARLRTALLTIACATSPFFDVEMLAAIANSALKQSE